MLLCAVLLLNSSSFMNLGHTRGVKEGPSGLDRNRYQKP